MEVRTDFLVIGSGIAGLSFALRAAKHGSVAVVTKRGRKESNTAVAQGGIAAVLDPEDTFEDHVRDTEVAGAGLCHHDVVEMVVRDAPERISELVTLGTRFARAEGGEWELAREGGHTKRRVVHAGDITGREIARALVAAAEAEPNIRIYDDHAAIDLITSKKHRPDAVGPWGSGGEAPGNKVQSKANQVLGAYVLDVKKDEVAIFCAQVVVLATGGSGKVYLYTSNPDVATGDGVAMGFRAGCSVANLEFIQFHPTCLYHPQAGSFLISEAVRGEGGILRTVDGTPFMERYHPALKDLAPRDIVARAIDAEMKRRGDEHVLLDISHKPGGFVKGRFPNLWETCKRFGFDMATEPIPVVPAAHYQCGGLVTDVWGETEIHNLFAIGEVGCTGLHGANRLASNSLLEGAVFGVRALDRALPRLQEARFTGAVREWDPGTAVDSDDVVVVTHNWDEVRRTMWNYVGIVRTDKRLARAKARIDLLSREIGDYYWNFKISRDLIELRNIALVGDLVIRCAMARRESRGLHYTLDYPQTSDDWKRDTVIASPAR